MPLQQRLQMDGLQNEPARPLDARSEVTRELDGVRITIPNAALPSDRYVLTLIPVVVSLVFVSPLLRFFRQTRTPEPVGLMFIGFILLFFGVLPAMTALNGYLRVAARPHDRHRVAARHRYSGARRLEDGSGELAAASEILDIDFSTSESLDDSPHDSPRNNACARPRQDPGGRQRKSAHARQWLLTTLRRVTPGARHHHQDPPGPDDIRPGARPTRENGLRPLNESVGARRLLGPILRHPHRTVRVSLPLTSLAAVLV